MSASSRSALKNSLTGISVDVQGTDYSEVAYESGKSLCFYHSSAKSLEVADHG